MTEPDTGQLIELIMRSKFTDVSEPFRILPSMALTKMFREYIECADDYRDHLGLFLTLSDLKNIEIEIHNNNIEYFKENHCIPEEEFHFNWWDAVLDINFWSKVATWTLDEAVSLSLGRQPSHSSWAYIEPLVGRRSFATEFGARRELLKRAHLSGQIEDPATPTEILVWANKRVSFPVDLIEAVHSFNDPKDRRKSDPTNATESTHLLSEKGLGTRERDSLLRLVIGMAVTGYSYDPKSTRSKITQEIANDLELSGVGLDVDTVRRYLNEAKGLLPPSETE